MFSGHLKSMIYGFLVLCFLSVHVYADDDFIKSSLERAVLAAREGDFDTSIPVFEELYKMYPSDQRVIGDYITVLNWKEDHAAVSELLPYLDITTAPEYVLPAAANSLRKNRMAQWAVSVYEEALRRFPDNPELNAGYAMVLADTGDYEKAQSVLSHVNSSNHSDVEQARLYTESLQISENFNNEREAAVLLAREGDFGASIAALDSLYARYPNNQRLLYDYVAVHNWAEQYSKANRAALDIDLSRAPAYAIAAAAENLRKSGQFMQAYAIYREGYERYPNAPSIALGYAIITAETRYPQDGQGILDIFRRDNPDVAIAEAEAAANYIIIIGGRGNTSIRAYDNPAMAELDRTSDILTLTPDNSDAMHGLVNALILLEASSMASEYLQNNPYAASEQEQKLNEAAYYHKYTTWARSAEDKNPKKQEFFATALSGLDGLLAESACNDFPGCVNIVNSYRVVALSETGKHKEALTLYENLVPDVDYPNDIVSAAARSYLALKQAEKAQQTYIYLINSPRTPEEELFDAYNGLFWAYLDGYNFKKTREMADFLKEKYLIKVQDCRSTFNRAAAPLEYHFGEGEAADIMIGQSYLYSGETECAETYFRNILDTAPAHTSALTALAVTQDIRGLPRSAQESLRMAETAYTYDPYYDILSYTFNVSNRQWKQAEQDLDRLKEQQPGNTFLPALERRQGLRDSFEFRMSANIGMSQEDSAGASSQNEPSTEMYLYSKPFLSNWRAFGGYRHAKGQFDEGNATQNRYMAGVEYSAGYFEGTTTLGIDDVGSTITGFGVEGTFFLTDHWQFPVAAEINSAQTPLRALYNGVTADRLAAGVTYYVNDYRQFSFTSGYMDFDDNNNRMEFGLSWSERVFTYYSHSVTMTLSGYTSFNSNDDDHLYYNPKRDGSLEASLSYSGLLLAWPSGINLTHNASVGGGPYHQADVGTSFVYSLDYSHNWVFGERITAGYGYTFSSSVYDAQRENNHNIYLSAGVLF